MAETSASAAPPRLENHRVVAEGFTGPTHPELLPYVRRRPLVRMKQGGWPEESPTKATFDLVVFDDGKVFFEGVRCVARQGLQIGALDDARMLAVRRLLDARCATLAESTHNCMHTTTTSIACQVREKGYAGVDMCSGLGGRTDPGRNTVAFGAEVIRAIGIGEWLGDGTKPRCGWERGYVATEIERTLSPVPWKTY